MSLITTETLLVITILATMNFCMGQAMVKTFSTSIPGRRPDDYIMKGNDVLLLCEAANNPSAIQIMILKDGTVLNVSRETEQSLTYTIKSVSCDDIGTYECVVDQKNSQKTNVIVADCDLRPCQGDDVNRTLFVDEDEPVQISVCVLAAAGILPYVEVNSTNVSKKRHSNWDYQQSQSTKGDVNINITRDYMVKDEYGLLKLRILSAVGKRYYIDYNIRLQPPGPPECPSNATVIGQGHDLIMLSWRPGLYHGSKQEFHIYLSKDNVSWYRYDVRDGLTSVNLTGLQENTTYYFTVVSSNVYSLDVNETLCDNMISGTTTTEQGSKQEITCAVYLVLPICALTLAIFLAAAMMVLFYKQRANKSEHSIYDKAEFRKREDSQVFECISVSRL